LCGKFHTPRLNGASLGSNLKLISKSRFLGQNCESWADKKSSGSQTNKLIIITEKPTDKLLTPYMVEHVFFSR
jgi:hypothetical protein